jgi:hypothetical protein
MKIKMEFDSLVDAMDSINGHKWKSVVWDVDQELRRYLKYDDTIDEKTYDVVEKIRVFLRESVHDNGVSLND